MKILGAISDGVVDVADLMTAFLKLPYYKASVGSFEYQFQKLHTKRMADREKRELEKKARQRFYSAVSRLREDGLLKKDGGRKNAYFEITSLGRKKLGTLLMNKDGTLPEPRYASSSGEHHVIVTFDIPEKERRKREWLRCVLKNLKFQMIQQSVWIGKTKIPKDFLNDLHEMKLSKYVEIFEVSKKGTLCHVI